VQASLVVMAQARQGVLIKGLAAPQLHGRQVRFSMLEVERMKRSNFLPVLFIVTLLLGSSRLWGHAVVVESTPKMNGIVNGPTLQIKLRFNARVDGKRSKVAVVDQNGVSRPIHLAQQVSPDSLLANISGLQSGKYQLHWQVLASDGHITQGDIPFSVVNP
jgi:methionine-rich copper-binding protein CopC